MTSRTKSPAQPDGADSRGARCAATTRKGDQCRNPAAVGKKTCAIHGLREADPRAQPRTKW